MTPDCPVRIVYYLEVLSSWCHWVEPVWAELQTRYAGRVQFDWKIALMPPEGFPVSREQCDWFYQRSGLIMRSPYKLNSGWFDVRQRGNYDAASLVAEAGRDFDFNDDRLRLALAQAGMRDGRKLGDMATAAAVGAAITGVNAVKLRKRAKSPAVRARVEESTREFFSHQIIRRPAFVITDTIEDKAVFSGLVRIEPLAAAIDAMLADVATYATHAAHFGLPPKQ